MVNTEFFVEGMSCQHCVQTVTQALESVQGVSDVHVNLDNKMASVEFDEKETSENDLFAAVEAKDYTPKKKA